MEISQMCRILRPGRSAHFLSSSHTSSSWPSPSPEHGFSHWFLKQTQSSALSPEAPNRRVHDHVRISEREAVQRWEQRTMRAAILESCLAHALLSAPTQHSGNCLYLLGGVGGEKALGFKWLSGWVSPQNATLRMKHYLLWIYFHTVISVSCPFWSVCQTCSAD